MSKAQGVPASPSGHSGQAPEPQEGLGHPASVPNADVLITAGMLADRLRPIVLGGSRSCLNGTPMIPLHRGTVSAIYQHLERLADLDRETTLGALEHRLRRIDERHAAEREALESAIAAKSDTAEKNASLKDDALIRARDMAYGPSRDSCAFCDSVRHTNGLISHDEDCPERYIEKALEL